MSQAVALYSASALRTLEQRAQLESGDGFALMQRAGQAAWRCLLVHWPQSQRVVVACGPGNNGGDGYVLARHALQAGREVCVVRPGGEPEAEPAQRASREYAEAGGHATTFTGELPEGDVIVDALFGIGLSRAPKGVAAALIDRMNASGIPVFALDVPSGVDADRGSVPGTAVHARRTLQLLAPHPGLFTGAALDHCGVLELDRLGVDPGAVAVAARAVRPDLLGRWLPPRMRDSHKGANGHVLCIGGDHGSGGAILLCAEAALRSGAGLVSVATRAGHVPALLSRRPEAMARAVDTPAELAPLLARADVIAIGPGLGQNAWGKALLAAAIDAGKPLVADADALNLIAEAPRDLPADAILTPHPGEAARLLGSDVPAIQSDRFGAAAALEQRYGCVAVLKGAGTIVAAPGEIPNVIVAGNPGMAVGGMGDVLTGVIAALRAQKLAAIDAATCGALLHAMAGDNAARVGGERGLLASDLFVHLHVLANPGSSP